MQRLTWHSIDDLGLALLEAYPDVDPTQVNFVDLRNYVIQLPEFDDDPHASSEKKLEAIQMAWIEEYEDNEPLDDDDGDDEDE